MALSAAAQVALLCDWRLRSRLEVAATEGAQFSSVEEALACTWSKGRAVLLWRQGLRWLEAPLEDLSSTVRSATATISGSQRRSLVFEVDAYGTGWVVLSRAGDALDAARLAEAPPEVAALPQGGLVIACIPVQTPLVPLAARQVVLAPELMVVDAGPVVDAVPIGVLAARTRSEPQDPPWSQSVKGARRQHGESSLVVRTGRHSVSFHIDHEYRNS